MERLQQNVGLTWQEDCVKQSTNQPQPLLVDPWTKVGNCIFLSQEQLNLQPVTLQWKVLQWWFVGFAMDCLVLSTQYPQQLLLVLQVEDLVLTLLLEYPALAAMDWLVHRQIQEDLFAWIQDQNRNYQKDLHLLIWYMAKVENFNSIWNIDLDS